MITHRIGDIFEQSDLDGIIHQTNTRGVFGAGIAKTIAEKYPDALEVSEETCAELKSKALGSYDFIRIPDPDKAFYIINSYSQEGLGGPDRNTRYDAMANILTDLRTELAELAAEYGIFRLGVPYGFGCGLAKGSWTIVEAIFKSVFADYRNIEIVIVTNPKFADTVRK